MKKLILMFMVVFLLASVSALEFDNKITYSNNDLKIDLDNWFGLGVNYGSAELKSHTSVNEILNVGYGKEEVVMYYDFNFNELYENGLGIVSFTNKSNEEEIDMEYSFVYWEEKERNIYGNGKCNSFINGTKSNCEKIIVGTETYNEWSPYNSKDIPIGNIRIGLKVYVEKGDYIDAIWTIGGKEIIKHALWEANLNVGLITYYPLNETTGDNVEDVTGQGNNLTTFNMENGDWKTGKIGNGLLFDGADEFANKSTPFSELAIAEDYTLSFWLNGSTVSLIDGIFGNYIGANDRLGIAFENSKMTVRSYGGAGSDNWTSSTSNLAVNTWYHMIVIHFGINNSVVLYQDNVVQSGTEDGFTPGSTYFAIGSIDKSVGAGLVGMLDEIGIWNRTLTTGVGSEINDLYNSGNGITYTTVFGLPTITLNQPANETITTSQTIVFNATGIDYVGIANMTLIIDGADNETNSSVINATKTSFTKTIAEGFHTWTVRIWDSDDQTAIANTRTFTINSTPQLNVTSPTNITYTTSTIYFNSSNSLTIGTWIANYNGTNITITINDTIEVEDGNHHLLLYGDNAVSGVMGLNDTIYFAVDTVSPSLNITALNQTINFHKINTLAFINWSVSDSHLDKCWFRWNSTNTTVTCGNYNVTINISNVNINNVTFWANDTFGNNATDSSNWDYRLFQTGESFTTPVIEGSSATFQINLTTNGTDITIANLSYANEQNYGTITSSGDAFTITKSIGVPAVTVDTNKTFFWNITQRDGVYYALSPQNQSVQAMSVDNCTLNQHVLYNFTIEDEETKVLIPAVENTSAKLNLQIYTFATDTSILEYNKTFDDINPFGVCLNDTFTTESYSNNLQVQYSADTYSSELYHIQNETLNSSSFTTNITLYDVNASDIRVFKIIFRDSSFLPVENALIKVYRKYINENLYRIVEIPKTDAKGETIAHLVLNDIVYKFVVVKYGVTLATFTDVSAVCQIPLVKSCEIDLNAFSDSIDVPDFETAQNFNYTLGYSNTTRTISSTFIVPDGQVKLVTLNVTQTDALGTSVCTDSVTSSSGTLSCVVPTSFGNSTIVGKVFMDGKLKGFGQMKLDQKPSDIYGVSLTILAMFIMMTLIGAGISNNPVFTVIFLMIGISLLFALNLVANNGFIGSTATILWLVIAVVLLLIKGGRRN